LTASVLGAELGVARAVGAIAFSVLIGLAMHTLYRKEERARAAGTLLIPTADGGRPLWPPACYFAALMGVLVFANWGRPEATSGPWFEIWSAKWALTALFGAALGAMMVLWFGIRWWKMALLALTVGLAAVLLHTWALPAWGHLLPGFEDGLPWHAMLPFSVAVAGIVLLSSGRDAGDENREWVEQSWGFAKQITP